MVVRPRVFMDFAVGEKPYGRVIFELFSDTAPRTCENFRSLCTGERGISTSGHPLYYKNTIIHRCIKGFMIQGGDFSKHNGAGGESIHGGTFSDEDLQRPLDSQALLCMANKGPDTNGSQFFITLRECPHLDGKHVVFGKVTRGFDEVVLRLVEVPVDEKDRPTKPILITNCGELEFRERKGTGPLPNAKKPEKHRHQDSTPDRPAVEGYKKGRKRKRPESKEEKLDAQGQLPKETEEEYDARLEREEAERLERERQCTLARIRESYRGLTQTGIRYKGRGRMKYVDPEHQHRS